MRARPAGIGASRHPLQRRSGAMRRGATAITAFETIRVAAEPAALASSNASSRLTAPFVTSNISFHFRFRLQSI
ncbi:hypothetical protein [Burkholderia singularis]|uniref:hypothetical protein n=1 Tax=Burkholderia singularis TaxID=1503053 RepID=UPI000F78F369|nr:hypothetical protein [Burkholderia singularis]